MEAIWGTDYDHHTDSIYRRPACPECGAGIGKAVDGEYHCFCCGEIVYVTDTEMKEWFSLREKTMKIAGPCYQCGREYSMVTHYIRNPASLDFDPAYGVCKSCGAKFIV